MPSIKEEIEIAAPRADVFRFCHDLKKRSEWDEQIVRAELLTPAPVRTGTLLRMDARHGGGSLFTWDAEYISFHLPRESRLRAIDTAAASPFAAGSQLSWQLDSVGTNTRFTWTWDYKAKGIVANIKDKLGGRAATQRAIQRSLANLKEMMEAR